MTSDPSNDPLHGITLRAIMEDLLERRGWEDLAALVKINCFANDPSLKSSLKFLRKTDWARKRVEELYLADRHKQARNQKRNQRRASMRAFRKAQDAGQTEATTSPSESASEQEVRDPVDMTGEPPPSSSPKSREPNS